MPVDPARAKSLFLDAADLPDAERAAYLDRECGGDIDLRGRVEALLRADAPPLDDATGTFAADAPTAAPEPGRTADHSNRDEQPGTVLAGKYRLSEPIGEGGMGSVWVAHQSEPVKRKVAVKLIKAGMDSKSVLARFEAERQALTVMDHPNIAKVLDGGLTPDGRPFFVMELVKGVPITEYCDACKLTPQQRLELFVPVCQAIQHAHQKGIIHRDIKPNNVLVALYDDEPVPKVIDFGIAKAAGGVLTEQTIETAFGGVVGTPQYMSPEQASLNNLDIDTRSDVYALGVLLYELLTGSPPFARNELEKKGLLEILRVVREEEPPRPSTKLSTADALATLSANRGTEPKKLTGLLRNELDWIVMKALEKDRTRRYETANGFAADVLRYLGGEAVQAHPPSARYRVKKFVQKNRTGVMVASAFFWLSAGAVAMGTYLAVRATDAEKRAVHERDDANAARSQAEEGRQAAEVDRGRALKQAEIARAVEKFLGEDLIAQVDVSAPFQGASNPDPEIKLKTAIDRAARKIPERFAGSRLTEASVRTAIGRAYVGLGLYSEARPHLESARRLCKSEPDMPGLPGVDAAIASETAQDATFHLGLLEMAQGRVDVGAQLLRESGNLGEGEIELMLNTARGKPVDLDLLAAERGKVERARAADARFDDWLVFVDPSRLAELEVVLRKKIEQQQRAGNGQREVCDLMVSLASVYLKQGRVAQAEVELVAAHKGYKRLLGESNPHTVLLGGQVGEVRLRLGRYEEAEPLLRLAWDSTKRELPDSLTPIQIQSALGAALAGQNKYVDAEQMLRNSYEGAKAYRGQAVGIGDLARTTLDRLVELCTAAGKPDDATKWRTERAKYPEVAPPPREKK